VGNTIPLPNSAAKTIHHAPIDAYMLSFHGHLLIEGADISLNYGQRYGLSGKNGSGKVKHYRFTSASHSHDIFILSTFLQSIAECDIEIPSHIDIYLVCGEVEPSNVNAANFIIIPTHEKLEKQIEDLSIADNVRNAALEAIYKELKEMGLNYKRYEWWLAYVCCPCTCTLC
jgi:ATP-binding cassette subfamily F protein 2